MDWFYQKRCIETRWWWIHCRLTLDDVHGAAGLALAVLVGAHGDLAFDVNQSSAGNVVSASASPIDLLEEPRSSM